MKSIWSDENKFKTWELVELTVAEIMSNKGIVPKSSLEVIKSKTKFAERKHKNKSEINFIVNQFIVNKVNILDFGAGWGHWLNSGEKLKYSPYALEMSKHRKKYISNLGIRIIDYITR